MKYHQLFACLALGFMPAWALNAPRHEHTISVASKAAKKTKTPNFSFHELYNLTTNFFDNFAYPNNAIQAKKINSTLFATDVLGRVDVTRNFDGQELNTEYAFGLFSNLALNPGSFTLLGVPVAYTITHFAANQNIISVALIVDFNITALGVVNPVEVCFSLSAFQQTNIVLTTTKVDFWATFNEAGQIDQYDATFRYLQWQFDSLMSVGQTELGLNSTSEVETAVGEKLAASICATAQTYCNGTNLQYNSAAACYEYLTQEVRFGQAYEMGMNTLLCRMVHQNMVPYRPDVHCSHIGPTGGGYCTDDRTYTGTVTQSFFTNHPFVPYGYANKNATLQAE